MRFQVYTWDNTSAPKSPAGDKGEDIVHAISNDRLTCARQFGPNLLWAL